MKAYGGGDVYIYFILTSELNEDEWSASRAGRFTTEKISSGIHCVGGGVAPEPV
jgi:hypothetical protein